MRVAVQVVCGVMLATGGCKTVQTVPRPAPGAVDSSPPSLRLGTAGLKTDLSIDEHSLEARRRVKRVSEILLTATATDLESGVDEVLLDISTTDTCGGVADIQHVALPRAAPTTADTLPTTSSHSYVFRPSGRFLTCRAPPASLSFSLAASARNGVGDVRTLPSLHFTVFGPDRLAVTTFNVKSPDNHPDAVYTAWGRELGAFSDVLLLTEIPDRRRADLMATAAGMAWVVIADDGDVAIVSRTPLYDVKQQIIRPENSIPSAFSRILSAKSDLLGSPHQFIVTHWGTRDANNVQLGSHQSGPGRVQAALAILELAEASMPVILGGDLNAYSGFGPQDEDRDPDNADWVGSTPEHDALTARFRDPFVELGMPPFCSTQRIDYVLVSGPLEATAFEACSSVTGGSDHPPVSTTFEPGGQP